MCGRFTRKEKDRHLAEALKIIFPTHLKPRYNIAPSQLIECVRSNPESKEPRMCGIKVGPRPVMGQGCQHRE